MIVRVTPVASRIRREGTVLERNRRRGRGITGLGSIEEMEEFMRLSGLYHLLLLLMTVLGLGLETIRPVVAVVVETEKGGIQQVPSRSGSSRADPISRRN